MENYNKQRFDITEFISICKIHWKWYVVAILIGLLFGCYKYLKSYPTYTVESKILMYDDNSAGSMSLVKQFSVSGILGGSGAVDDEIKVLQSHSLMEQTARQFGLNENYTIRQGLFRDMPVYCKAIPVKVLYDPILQDTLTNAVKFEIKVSKSGSVDVKATVRKKTIGKISDSRFPATMETSYGQFTFVTTDAYNPQSSLKETAVISSYSGAAEMLEKKILVSIPDKKSSMISISFVTPDAKFGQQLLDSIVSNYNARGIAERRRRDEHTAALIERRLFALAGELNLSEEAEEAFQENQQIVDFPTQVTELSTRMLRIKEDVEHIKFDIEQIDLLRDFLRDSKNQYALIPFEASADVSALGTYNSMISTYNAKILDRMRLLAGAKSDNIALKNATEWIDAYRDNILSTMDKASENARTRYNEILSKQRELQSSFLAMPSQLRDYRAIQRNHSIKEQLYLFLLQQREETLMTIENGQPRAVIVDQAFTHNEVNKFGKLKLIAIAIFVGLFLPTAILFVTYFLRRRVLRESNFGTLTSTPLLSDVLRDEKNDSILAVTSESSPSVIESFRRLRNNLQFILPGNDEKVVLFTSVRPNEGATYVAVNTAAALALQGKRVVILDSDFRHPTVADAVGISSSVGLVDKLRNHETSLSAVIQNVQGETAFDVIPAGSFSIDAVELLAGEETSSVIEGLKNSYDYVLILASPVGEVTDGYAFGQLVDATVFVVKSGSTAIEDLHLIEKDVADERFPKVSIVRLSTVKLGKQDRVYGSNK